MHRGHIYFLRETVGGNVCYCKFWWWGGGVDKLWMVETSEGWMVIVAGHRVIWGTAGLSGAFRYLLSSRGGVKEGSGVQTTVREFA